MSLKNKLKLGIVGLSLLVGLNTAKSQSIEGYVNSSESYPRPPLENVLVSAGSLGEDFTDINGYYHIPPLAVIPPVQLNPLHGRQIRYGIWDVLGRKVFDISSNQSLDNMLNRLSSGFYVARTEDKEGIASQVIIARDSDIFKGRKNYEVRYNNDVSNQALDNLSNNPLNNGLVRNSKGVDTDYIFTVSDDNIPQFMGSFYDYIDTLAVDTAVTKNVRLIPQFTIGTVYYQEGLELINDLGRPYVMPDSIPGNISNYGEYPTNELAPYPQRVWLNPQQAQQYCGSYWPTYIAMETTLIDSINAKTQREGLCPVDLFTVVDDSTQANIKVYYDVSGNSNWSPNYQNGDLIGGAVHMKYNLENPQGIYAIFGHELGIHGIGMKGHSDDPAYVSYYVPALDFQEAEIKAIVNYVSQFNHTWMYNFVEE